MRSNLIQPGRIFGCESQHRYHETEERDRHQKVTTSLEVETLTDSDPHIRPGSDSVNVEFCVDLLEDDDLLVHA